MQELELRDNSVDRVMRLDRLRQLVGEAGQEDVLNAAYDALRLASYSALSNSAEYINGFADFFALVLLGNADQLEPELRVEIEQASTGHRVHVAEAGVMISAYAVLLLGKTFKSQPEAVRARAVLSGMVDGIAEQIGDELGFERLSEFLDHTGKVVQDLTYISANQIPLVRVEIGVPVPSTLIAWKLYQDPERAGELLNRNAISTPVYMPTSFEALSS